MYNDVVYSDPVCHFKCAVMYMWKQHVAVSLLDMIIYTAQYED